MNKPISISVYGIVLPNRPLTNVELIDSVKKLRIPRFRGVFVRDALPQKPNKNESGILNLDDSSGNGTHWVLWHRNNNKNFYFDSYGIQPPLELYQYLKSSIFYNTEKNSTKRRSILWAFVFACIKTIIIRMSSSRNHEQFTLNNFTII